jgi:hypothetical protein
MNKDTTYTLVAIALVVVGAIILFYIAKAILGFLLDHWVAVILCLIVAVGGGLYYLLQTESKR